jgi:hypothetical protein
LADLYPLLEKRQYRSALQFFVLGLEVVVMTGDSVDSLTTGGFVGL